MRLRCRRRPLFAVLCLSLLVFSPFAVVRWSASEVVSPPRRKLMDYHKEFLADLPAHGIRAERFTASDGTPCLVVSPGGSAGERGTTIRRQLESRGLRLKPFGQVHGTVVLVHGRKGRKEDYLAIAERFCACGFRCLIPDMPAHGDHPATVATYGVREAVIPELVLGEASSHFGFPAAPAGLMGMSMGGSVVVHAASRPAAPWRALVVVASFDSLRDVVHAEARDRLGTGLGGLLMTRVESIYQDESGVRLAAIRPIDRIPQLRMPTLIAHGTADAVVPLSAGKRLHAALPADLASQWIEIPDAGHDNVLVTGFPIYAAMAEWFLTHVR